MQKAAPIRSPQRVGGIHMTQGRVAAICGFVVIGVLLVLGIVSRRQVTDKISGLPEILQPPPETSFTSAEEPGFPRRMCAICVTNYLYANPLQYGSFAQQNERDRRDFYAIANRLANGWKIPEDQRYFITDGPLKKNKIDETHLPLKSVIEGSLSTFLKTSRTQDRLVILFSGHAVEKDGQAYLVPLEGELDDIATLIPLKNFYAQLEKCPAQEKLVIFDVCRFDPGRGIERPIFGKMTPALEKALHDCPASTTVLSSCSAGQFAYEYEFWQAHVPGLYRLEYSGSVFLSLFLAADLKRAALSKGPNGDHKPEEPLPIGRLADYLKEVVPLAIKDLEKQEQTPKLTSKPGEPVEFDPKEALPKRFELTAAPATAKREQVASMFREMRLPPIRALISSDAKELMLSSSFPFPEEQLKPYYDDNGPTFEQIRTTPEKFEENFPLRVAVVKAAFAMSAMRQEYRELPEEIRVPINEQYKKRVTQVFQKYVAARYEQLGEVRELLADAAKHVDKEKSKRWLAHFDYMHAQVRIRLAYLNEYNVALAKVKLEDLPKLEARHKGWKLATTEKMSSPALVRRMADDGVKLLEKVAKDHPNTPWAVLAKSQRHLTLGLEWLPSTFDADDR